MKNTKMPTIRFKGFNDDWEQRKLGDMMEVTSVKRIHQSDWTDSGVRFLRARDIVAESKNEEVSELLFISQEKYDEYSAVSGKVEKGDLLVTGVGTIGVPMLINSEEPLYFKDGNIIWFKNKNAIDGRFFYHSFNGLNIQKFIKESAGTGTVGTYTIENGKKTPINLPLQKEEQEKIGEYFSNLDHLITLHQRKLEKIKLMKKSMLGKMFPKDAESIPKIRFNRYTDDWEQRKLGDVAQEFKSGNSLKADEIDITGDYPVYGGNGLRGYTSTYNYDGEYALIGRQGALCGNMNYSVGKAYFTEHAVVVKADENNDTRFLYYMLDTMNLGQYSDQSAQPGLAVNKLVKLENQFPTKEEQQRMGWYFSNIDHLITLHQRKLEKLKKVKKSLLEHMFPMEK